MCGKRARGTEEVVGEGVEKGETLSRQPPPSPSVSIVSHSYACVCYAVRASEVRFFRLSYFRRVIISRWMSRLAWAVFIACRLSCCCFPRQIPSTTFASPRLKCISRGTKVRPFS